MDFQEFELQKEKDLAVIDAFKVNSADMAISHKIEHHFITYSKESGLELLTWAAANDLETSELAESIWRGERYYYFDLIIPTVPTIDNIFPDTRYMLYLAEEYNYQYDGWGRIIIK
ncbi:MAG: ribonuclease E inhibitor RraB [Sedimentisphaerales bacterium]